MSIDVIVTIAIGLVAAVYIGAKVRRSAISLLEPSSADGCGGGCSGCGTPDGHADSEENCTVRETLITLGKKTKTSG